jgi:hypothetical protein
MALAGAAALPVHAQAQVQVQAQVQAQEPPAALADRVAAVRAALKGLAPAAELSPLLQTATANWTNWPKWGKWSNWANK